MKRVSIILMLVGMLVLLAGCSVLEARYAAVAQQQQTKQAQAYAQAETARANTQATQAIQATAQVSQVEASNRLMAFLATVSAVSQSDTVLVAAFILAFGLAAAASLAGRVRQ